MIRAPSSASCTWSASCRARCGRSPRRQASHRASIALLVPVHDRSDESVAITANVRPLSRELRFGDDDSDMRRIRLACFTAVDGTAYSTRVQLRAEMPGVGLGVDRTGDAHASSRVLDCLLDLAVFARLGAARRGSATVRDTSADTTSVAGTKIGIAAAERQGRRVGAARRATTRAAGTATLAQITPANAKNLHVSWTFSTGVLRGHEGQPLVVDNTMYLVTPYPNVAYAIDLTQPGLSAQVEVPPGERAGGGGHRVLRRRESRCVVRRRQDRLQPARRTHRRRRRRDGHGAVAARRWATSIAARRSRWRRSS